MCCDITGYVIINRFIAIPFRIYCFTECVNCALCEICDTITEVSGGVIVESIEKKAVFRKSNLLLCMCVSFCVILRRLANLPIIENSKVL